MDMFKLPKNQRQLRLMSQFLTSYQDRELSLRELVNSLEALLEAMEAVPKEWDAEFRNSWLALEIANARSIEKGVEEILSQHRNAVDKAIQQLILLIEKNIDPHLKIDTEGQE